MQYYVTCQDGEFFAVLDPIASAGVGAPSVLGPYSTKRAAHDAAVLALGEGTQ